MVIPKHIVLFNQSITPVSKIYENLLDSWLGENASVISSSSELAESDDTLQFAPTLVMFPSPAVSISMCLSGFLLLSTPFLCPFGSTFSLLVLGKLLFLTVSCFRPL